MDLIRYFASLYYRLLSLGACPNYDDLFPAFYRQYLFDHPETQLDYTDFCWNVNDEAEHFFCFCIIH